MGIFSNGTEAGLYVEKYCQKCINRPRCNIMYLHRGTLTNEDIMSVLNQIIPFDKDGNGQCVLYMESTVISIVEQMAHSLISVSAWNGLFAEYRSAIPNWTALKNAAQDLGDNDMERGAEAEFPAEMDAFCAALGRMLYGILEVNHSMQLPDGGGEDGERV